MKKYDKQFIGGEWREGTGASLLEDINPYTGEVLYTYRSASKQDVDDAYEAAVKAQKVWAKTSPNEKKELIAKLADVILEMKDELYEVLTEEGGSTQSKCGFEFGDSYGMAKEALRYPHMMEGRIIPSNIPGKENYIWRSPKGVICVIAPFNFPVILALRSIIPAVACGNAVVLKPSSDTPATAMLIGEYFEKAGFPKGLVNCIAGKGDEIGDYVVQHKSAALVSFTGSTAVGSHIGEMAGKEIKDMSLELGGNNTMIVLEDANIEQAAKAAVMGSYCHQGQVCMCLNRCVVLPAVYDKFVEEVVKEAKTYTVGDPKDPNTALGPVVNPGQVAKIKDIVEGTIKAGAKVELEGKFDGNMVYPWVLSDVTNDMPSAAKEVFGPVVSILRAADEEDAIRIANDTEYGLSNSVYSGDRYHGIEVAKQMDSGMVHVNDQSINFEPHLMFGGAKKSGIGRFNNTWAIEEFTEDKWISVTSVDLY